MTAQDNTCTVYWLGRADYLPTWDLQRELALARSAGNIGDVLLLVEHPHVYTLGRRAEWTNILRDPKELQALGAVTIEVDRGGDVTYHGPGQLVAYPILDLRQWRIGPVTYVRILEQAVVDTLDEYGITAGRVEGFTGVWVDGAKITAIGVRISRGVTTHGLALNVSPDLSYFGSIVPCGIVGCDVTSMTQLLGKVVDMEVVRHRLVTHLQKRFGFEIIEGEEGHFYDLLSAGALSPTA